MLKAPFAIFIFLMVPYTEKGCVVSSDIIVILFFNFLLV